MSAKIKTGIGLALWSPVWLVGLVVAFFTDCTVRAFNIFWPGEGGDTE